MPAAPRDLSASGTLYSVLGVTPSASPEEVRRAYRSLARRLHPDSRRSEKGLRAGAAAAEFSIVSEAFEVLNDEVRRDMYDSIGLDGLRFYEWVQKIGPAGPKAALPPVVLAAVLCVGCAALALLLAIFLLLAALRHDGSLRAPSWPLLFAPLFLANPLLLLVASLLSSQGPADRKSAALRVLPSVLLLAAFEGLLCAKLEAARLEEEHPLLSERLPWLSWLLVSAPLLISRGTAIAALPSELSAARRAVARSGTSHASTKAQPLPASADMAEAAGPPPVALSPMAATTAAFARTRRLLSRLRGRLAERVGEEMDGAFLSSMRQLAWHLLSALQLSLLPPRLEGLLLCSWRLMLLPSWLWLLVEVSVTAIVIRHEEVSRLRAYATGTGTGTPQQQMRRALRQSKRGAWISGLLAGASFLWWVAARLDATDAGSAPTTQLWMPILLGLGCFVGCVGCVGFSATSARRAASRAWERERTSSRASSPAPPTEAPTPRDDLETPRDADSKELDPLERIPAEGDVDPADVIRAAFAPMPQGQPLPGAMPNALDEPSSTDWVEPPRGVALGDDDEDVESSWSSNAA